MGAQDLDKDMSQGSGIWEGALLSQSPDRKMVWPASREGGPSRDYQLTCPGSRDRVAGPCPLPNLAVRLGQGQQVGQVPGSGMEPGGGRGGE